MSAPTALRPTGDRATRKVRAVAEQHRARLGGLRHVESSSPPPRVIIWTVAILGALAVGLFFENGIEGVAGTAAVCTAWVLVAVVILVFLGGEKILVLERGILIGSFAPFLTPYALGFDQVDARSISANLAGPRGIGLLLAHRGAGRASRTVPWSLRSLTFTAAAPAVVRHHAARGGALVTDLRFFVLWSFSVRHPRRLAPLVHALANAMQAAGVPEADDITSHALPARRLHRTVADADRLRIPAGDRAPGLR